MIGEKCPLCDGPVSGGRCTLCGMPYRKDEILYHLNENSRDHYKHATDKARDIMRKNAGGYPRPSAAGPPGSGEENDHHKDFSSRQQQEIRKEKESQKSGSRLWIRKEEIRKRKDYSVDHSDPSHSSAFYPGFCVAESRSVCL